MEPAASPRPAIDAAVLQAELALRQQMSEADVLGPRQVAARPPARRISAR